MDPDGAILTKSKTASRSGGRVCAASASSVECRRRRFTCHDFICITVIYDTEGVEAYGRRDDARKTPRFASGFANVYRGILAPLTGCMSLSIVSGGGRRSDHPRLISATPAGCRGHLSPHPTDTA